VDLDGLGELGELDHARVDGVDGGGVPESVGGGDCTRMYSQ